MDHSLDTLERLTSFLTSCVIFLSDARHPCLPTYLRFCQRANIPLANFVFDSKRQCIRSALIVIFEAVGSILLDVAALYLETQAVQHQNQPFLLSTY